MESQEHALTVAEGNRLTLLDQVIGETIDTAFRESFTTGLASMLVAVTRILQFRAPIEELKDELIGFASHFGNETKEEGGFRRGVQITITYL